MGFKKLIDKYADILKRLPAERQDLAVKFAQDGFALVADRIQNNGISSEGDKFKLYSRNPIALWKYDNMRLPQGKLKKFKDDVRKGKTTSSYENFRKSFGFPTDKRTMTVTEDMWQSIEQVVTKHDINVTEVTIRAKDRKNQNKVNNNSRIVGGNILKFSDDEEDFLRELNAERIRNLFTGA
jgi:hypothetical protein